MLKVKVFNEAGAEVEYASEATAMTISVRANEMSTIPASMPTTTMTLTLFTKDIAMLRDAKKVQVTTDEATLTTAEFSVINVTPLQKKGVVEIACEAVPLPKSTAMTGLVTLPSEETVPWTEVQQAFGLGGIELENTISTPVSILATRKEDLVMGLVWGMPKRQAVATAPYADFAVSAARKMSGAVIFNDRKPVLGDTTSAPFYKIERGSIIDYNIEAAQQAVTHIITRNAATPRAENAVSYEAMGQQEEGTVRVLWDPDDEIAAVYSATYEGDQFTNQKLTWSDNMVSVVPFVQASGKVYIMGIMPGFYILQDTLSTVVLVSRETGEVVSSQLSIPTADLNVLRNVKYWRTKYIDTASGRRYFVFSDSAIQVTGSDNEAYVGFAIDESLQLVAVKVSNALGHIDGVCTVDDTDGDALVLTINGTRKVVIDANYAGATLTATTLAGNTCGAYTDIIAESKTGSVWIVYGDDSTRTIRIVEKTDTTAQVLATNARANRAMWCYSRQDRDLDPTKVPILTSGDVLSTKYVYPWAVGKLRSDYSQIDWLYGGDPIMWAGSEVIGNAETADISLRNGLAQLKVSDETSYRSVIAVGAAPLTTVRPGDLSVRTEIAKGVENPATLGFKIGPVSQIRQAGIEPDLGRVTIEFVDFKTILRQTKQEKPCSARAMDMMAMNSYVIFKLAPTDTNWSLGRITGLTLSFDGQMTETVSVVIVDTDFVW